MMRTVPILPSRRRATSGIARPPAVRRARASVLVRLTVLALAAGCLATGCSRLPGGDDPEPSGRLVLASGGTQGVYYLYASALAEQLERRAPDLRVSVVATKGSVDNLQLLAAGKATCAFVADDAAAEAAAGAPPFDGPVDVTAVARVYDDYLHLVVPASGPVSDLAGLRGRTVSIGPTGSGTSLVVQRLLAASPLPGDDMTVRRLGINESVAALRTGEIDAFFWSGGLPTAGVADLADQLPLRVVPLGQLAPNLRQSFGAVYRSAAIPAGTYGSTEDVATVAIPNFLVCGAGTDHAVVRALVSTLFEGREELVREVPVANALDRRAAIETDPLPLHPAATEWFRENKVLIGP